MSDIRLLPDDVISKIAAGEVIERPAGVLKELLENAADAGAKNISVDIEGAGRLLLRVHDDGNGMDPKDLPLALVRHATSKIKNFSDMESLRTFGFRGEALYSIGAVSRLSITTCRKEDHDGSRISAEGGKPEGVAPAAPVKGTTVEVRDLFFNVPARLKFLKSDNTEKSQLIKTFEEAALANPHIGFNMNADGRKIYQLAPFGLYDNAAAINRVSAVFGNAAKGLLYSSSGFLSAYFSSPDNLQSSRGMQFVFVNRRPVFSKIVQQAVMKAYEGYRRPDRHPAYSIFITLPPADFDVNIHPQKREVRFQDDGAIFRAVYKAVGEGLLGAKTIPASSALREDAFADFAKAVRPEASKPDTIQTTAMPVRPAAEIFPQPAAAAPSSEVLPPQAAPVQEQISAPELPLADRHEWTEKKYRYIGQLDRSFLLFESEGGLLVMDQHAAQEKILFEKYMDLLERNAAVTEQFVVPVEAELSPSAAEAVLSWKDWLAKAGFEIEAFGPRTVQVHSAPAVFRFSPEQTRDFVARLADVLGDPQNCAEDVKRRIVAMAACKKAVKAHDSLTAQEAEHLLADLTKCRDGLSCPHGRPTMININGYELAKRFKRTSAV